MHLISFFLHPVFGSREICFLQTAWQLGTIHDRDPAILVGRVLRPECPDFGLAPTRYFREKREASPVRGGWG
jgi:hypothetical protein